MPTRSVPVLRLPRWPMTSAIHHSATGEGAIQDWFVDENEKPHSLELTAAEVRDFTAFNGNAQGFRVLTKCPHGYDSNGLQLACGTLGAFSKYPVASSAGSDANFKDIGIFACNWVVVVKAQALWATRPTLGSDPKRALDRDEPIALQQGKMPADSLRATSSRHLGTQLLRKLADSERGVSPNAAAQPKALQRGLRLLDPVDLSRNQSNFWRPPQTSPPRAAEATCDRKAHRWFPPAQHREMQPTWALSPPLFQMAR